MTRLDARGFAVEQFLQFLQKSPFNMLLFGLALASGTMLLWPLISRMFRVSNEVGAIDAVQLINRRDALVLDVRDTGDYAAGHIVGAKHIPEAQLADRIKELEKHRTRPIVVSCRTGSRAPSVSGMLRKKGFAEAVALRGGIAAWQQASLPLEKG
ncbi:MAG TPA: rhodanese-like domain-containing protein [Burkholderiales bacterium]